MGHRQQSQRPREPLHTPNQTTSIELFLDLKVTCIGMPFSERYALDLQERWDTFRSRGGTASNKILQLETSFDRIEKQQVNSNIDIFRKE